MSHIKGSKYLPHWRLSIYKRIHFVTPKKLSIPIIPPPPPVKFCIPPRNLLPKSKYVCCQKNNPEDV